MGMFGSPIGLLSPGIREKLLSNYSLAQGVYYGVATDLAHLSTKAQSARACKYLMNDQSLILQLQQVLNRTLPNCELSITSPPLCPELRLALIHPELSEAPLPHEAMLKVLETPAYWCFCWASGQVLAQYLHQNPAWVRGRQVIDFGAGSGIVGIAAKLAGAERVIAVDNDPDALAACRVNAAINKVDIKTQAELPLHPGKGDLIIAADVLYDRDNLPLLDMLPERADKVLIADSRIKRFAHPLYRKLGQKTATTWPDLEEHPEYNRVSIFESTGDIP
jgi:predicted nicotinamide N-methyase